MREEESSLWMCARKSSRIMTVGCDLNSICPLKEVCGHQVFDRVHGIRLAGACLAIHEEGAKPSLERSAH